MSGFIENFDLDSEKIGPHQLSQKIFQSYHKIRSKVQNRQKEIEEHLQDTDQSRIIERSSALVGLHKENYELKKQILESAVFSREVFQKLNEIFLKIK